MEHRLDIEIIISISIKKIATAHTFCDRKKICGANAQILRRNSAANNFLRFLRRKFCGANLAQKCAKRRKKSTQTEAIFALLRRNSAANFCEWKPYVFRTAYGGMSLPTCYHALVSCYY